MLEKPDIEDKDIINCLLTEFGLDVGDLDFLPLGADLNTAVYRAKSDQDLAYFVKLRYGNINKASLAIPNFLNEQGNKHIISSLMTKTGELWANLASFRVIVYPYVDGQNGFEAKMPVDQWVEFGKALRSLHSADIPAELTSDVPIERLSTKWRNTLQSFLAQLGKKNYSDPVAAELAGFLRCKEEEISFLIQRSERLSQFQLHKPPPFILCHADIHLWNLLLDAFGNLYMVDWDTIIFAPKERDLMYIGAGLGDSGFTPEEESTYFYQGYGPTEINPIALAFYRYERIIEDIALYCQQIFLSNKGEKDREQALVFVKSNFLPGGTIDVARSSDQVY
jgi:spectinomycin phosphotransferase